MLSLNNHANLSANILSIVATKCVIFGNLSQTTRIASFLATNSNLVMKSTIKYIYSFFGTLLNFSISASTSVQFFIP